MQTLSFGFFFLARRITNVIEDLWFEIGVRISGLRSFKVLINNYVYQLSALTKIYAYMRLHQHVSAITCSCFQGVLFMQMGLWSYSRNVL